MDLSTEVWVNINTTYPSLHSSFSLYNARSAWDSRRQLWIFQNDTNTCTYNPTTKSYSLLPSSKISAKTISYDSRRDVYLIVGGNSKTTRYFSPTNNCWYAPIINDSVTVGQGYLVYDSLNDFHAWVIQKNAKKFRLDTQGATAVEQSATNRIGIAPLKIVIHPNPFNPFTTISVLLRGNMQGVYTIYDVQGVLVRSFALKGDGEKKILWDGRNGDNKAMSSGLYIGKFRMQNHQETTHRLLLVK